MNFRKYILAFVLTVLCSSVICAQNPQGQRVSKRYNIFFRINSDRIDEDFSTNKRAID